MEQRSDIRKHTIRLPIRVSSLSSFSYKIRLMLPRNLFSSVILQSVLFKSNVSNTTVSIFNSNVFLETKVSYERNTQVYIIYCYFSEIKNKRS